MVGTGPEQEPKRPKIPYIRRGFRPQKLRGAACGSLKYASKRALFPERPPQELPGSYKTRVIEDYHDNIVCTNDSSSIQHLHKLGSEINAHIKVRPAWRAALPIVRCIRHYLLQRNITVGCTHVNGPPLLNEPLRLCAVAG